MYLTAVGLGLRRSLPGLFLQGEYAPLEASGSQQNHVVAFQRCYGERSLIAVAPRLVAAAQALPVGTEFWADTQVALPAEPQPAALRNVFTGESVAVSGGVVSVREALRTLPVALLCG